MVQVENREVLHNITEEKVGFGLAKESAANANLLVKNPLARKSIAELAARNLRTYESESLEDSVASFYPYYMFDWEGQRRFFSMDQARPEYLVRSQIDERERGGAALSGFTAVEDRVAELSGPGFFLWISPKGKAGDEGIFKNINYKYHQIYMGETDGRVTGSVALKSNIDEAVLAEWIHQLGGDKPKDLTPESFLKTSVVRNTGSSSHVIERVLAVLQNIMQQWGEETFYTDARGNKTKIAELPDLLRREKDKQDTSVRHLTQKILWEMGEDDRIVNEMRMRDIIGGQLMDMFGRYQDKNGNVMLTGCAGGTISINKLLGKGVIGHVSPISTAYRIRNAQELLDDDDDGLDSRTFPCPACGYENKRPFGKTISLCQNAMCSDPHAVAC